MALIVSAATVEADFDAALVALCAARDAEAFAIAQADVDEAKARRAAFYARRAA